MAGKGLLAAILVGAVCAALVALPTPTAGAYVLTGHPWPRTVITYRAPDSRADAVNFAAWTWNEAEVGVQFRPTSGPADIVIRAHGARCTGMGTIGWSRRGVVNLGRCPEGVASLVATHEFGHVIGLGHEYRRCALMNPYYDRTGSPKRCRPHPISYWLGSPLRSDDLRGAARLGALRRVSSPEQLYGPLQDASRGVPPAGP